MVIQISQLLSMSNAPVIKADLTFGAFIVIGTLQSILTLLLSMIAVLVFFAVVIICTILEDFPTTLLFVLKVEAKSMFKHDQCL